MCGRKSSAEGSWSIRSVLNGRGLKEECESAGGMIQNEKKLEDRRIKCEELRNLKRRRRICLSQSRGLCGFCFGKGK